MGPGIYVGRVGALAVALGIGAAVFMGQGVASAKPADTSGSDASKTTTSQTSGDTASTKTSETSGSPGASTTEKSDTAESSDATTTDAQTDDPANPLIHRSARRRKRAPLPRHRATCPRRRRDRGFDADRETARAVGA